MCPFWKGLLAEYMFLVNAFVSSALPTSSAKYISILSGVDAFRWWYLEALDFFLTMVYLCRNPYKVTATTTSNRLRLRDMATKLNFLGLVMSWTISYGAWGEEDGEKVIVLFAAGVGLELGYSDTFRLGKLVGCCELFELGSEDGYDEGTNNEGVKEGTEDGILFDSLSLLILLVFV